jgi:hypothetical protein
MCEDNEAQKMRARRQNIFQAFRLCVDDYIDDNVYYDDELITYVAIEANFAACLVSQQGL